MIFQPLQDGTGELRLITILPVEDEGAASSQVHCRLDVVSIDDRYHTRAYQKYLANKDEFGKTGELLKPATVTSQPSKERGFEDWVEVTFSKVNATVDLPEFRYTWGDYMALSYTWGDPSKTSEIFVNGVSIRATQNVEACLRVLRDKPYIRKGWKIWIDALCINQADIVERGKQVGRMRLVYSKAWTPILWLGDTEEDSDGAMELIRLLAETYNMRDQANALTQALDRDPRLFGVGRWRSLHQLATRRYWSRLWILQEAAMGRDDMPVLCGRHTLPWIDISRAFCLLQKTDEVIEKFIKGELEAAGLEFKLSIWATFYTVGEIQMLQDVQIGHCRTNLYRLLNLGRTVHASDPKDKVYGFLNLMDANLTALIKPDYTASIVDIYTDFAKATIHASGSLDVIRHCYPSSNRELPSWIPDWTVEVTATALTISNTPFTASGSSMANPRYLNNSKLMSCRGFQVDDIDGMGCMWSKGWSSESVVPTIGSGNPYGCNEAVRDALWKTMVVGRNTYSEPLNEDYSSLLATPTLGEAQFDADDPMRQLITSNIFDWCVSFLQGNSAFKICGREVSDYFVDGSRSGANIDRVHLRDALMQRDRVILYRRLITTKRGYVGMALETIRRDDVIYVLLGCSVPVVLRPVGEHFEFVGECYIHGIMEGEAMEWLTTEECQLENIVLC